MYAAAPSPSSSSDAAVLYAGRLASSESNPIPLALLSHVYHPPGTRHLSIYSDAFFKSTVRSAESAYCPRCFAFSDLAGANLRRKGVCDAGRCRSCPVCGSFLATRGERYFCGHCRWEGADKKEDGRGAFEDLVRSWRGKDVESKDAEDDPTEVWDASSLDASLAARARSLRVGGAWGGGASAPDATERPTELFAQPVKLIPRRGLRCRFEYEAAGRPGILVRPQLNVLEGDGLGGSALPTVAPWRGVAGRKPSASAGGWWKKDASGVHVLPRLTVVRRVSSPAARFLLLRVRNPTHGDVRLRLRHGLGVCTEEAPGEGGGGEGEAAAASASEQNGRLLQNLSASIRQIRGGTNEAILVPLPSDDGAVSDLMALGPAEDPSFADVSAPPVEEAEATWAPEEEGRESVVTFRTVATKGDCAWIEVGTKPAAAEGDEGSCTALPLALQVQVGGGSWEASLIRPKKNAKEEGDDGVDYVSFAVVILF